VERVSMSQLAGDLDTNLAVGCC